jgi:phosphoribosylformylglycinamidine cyclo-ligase
VAEFGRTLGEEALEPTALYTRACLDLMARFGPAVHAFSHVTGGGLAANLARVLPEGTDVIVHRDAWKVPPVFAVLRELGGVPWQDAERTWNLGVGMLALVDAAAAADAVAHLTAAGHPACVIGQTEVTRPEAAGSARPAAGVLGASVAGTNVQGTRVQGTKGIHGGAVTLEGTYRV